MHTKKEPFPGMNADHIKELVGAGQRPDHPQGMKASRWDLVQRCWAQNTEQRPSMVEVLLKFGGNKPRETGILTEQEQKS